MLGFMNDDGWKPRPTVHERRWRGLDGKETVADWICEPGCPVARLDAESLAGGIHPAGHAKAHDTRSSNGVVTTFGGAKAHDDTRPNNGGRYGDKGGASRFYKQVGGAWVPV